MNAIFTIGINQGKTVRKLPSTTLSKKTTTKKRGSIQENAPFSAQNPRAFCNAIRFWVTKLIFR